MELNVSKEVARLQKMTCGELRDEFANVTGETTNAKNRKWLIRRIVWRMQANVEGGLSADAINRIRKLGDGADLRVTSPATRRLSSDAVKRTRVVPTGVPKSTMPIPGTLITRTYKGRELRVRVTQQGFEFEGDFFWLAFGRRQTRHRLALERKPVLWVRREARDRRPEFGSWTT